MYRTFTPQVPFPSKFSLLIESKSKSALGLPKVVRGFREKERRPKSKTLLRNSSSNIKNETRSNSPVRSSNKPLSLKGQNDLPFTERPLSYSRIVISLNLNQNPREEMKTIRPKQTSSSIKEQDNILPLTDRVEMNNGLYTNRETRARSVSTVTLRSKHDGIKNSAKQELTKTLSNFKPNLKRSSIPKEHKTLNEFSKEYLPPAERIRNSPIKILRAKSINIVPASFDNSPYQECVDVGVYKYSGIHKGSVGRVQLTLKESNEHKLNKNNKSPIDISIPSGSPKGRESLKFFRPQKSSLKIGFENNKNPGNRIQQENKAFESLLRSLEESSGGSRELKEELKEKVEVTSTKEQKEQKPNKMLFYSRQLTAQTYLFNKNMMLGQKDEIEGDKIENRKELSGRLNSHFLLSDLIKKRKR